MLSRFTGLARDVVAQAQEEARQLHSPSVRPEHIFLALVGQPQGVGGWVLSELGVTSAVAREKAELVAGRGDRPVRGEIAFSPEFKTLLQLALDEARDLRHSYIGTEHLLLAMFQVSDAPIPDLLQHFHLTKERARDLILQELALPRPQQRRWKNVSSA